MGRILHKRQPPTKCAAFPWRWSVFSSPWGRPLDRAFLLVLRHWRHLPASSILYHFHAHTKTRCLLARSEHMFYHNAGPNCCGPLDEDTAANPGAQQAIIHPLMHRHLARRYCRSAQGLRSSVTSFWGMPTAQSSPHLVASRLLCSYSRPSRCTHADQRNPSPCSGADGTAGMWNPFPHRRNSWFPLDALRASSHVQIAQHSLVAAHSEAVSL
jgi:hypothetical protein